MTSSTSFLPLFFALERHAVTVSKGVESLVLVLVVGSWRVA